MRLEDLCEFEIERDRRRAERRRERFGRAKAVLAMIAFAAALLAMLALLAWMTMVLANAQDRLARRQARSFAGAVAMAARTPIW